MFSLFFTSLFIFCIIRFISAYQPINTPLKFRRRHFNILSTIEAEETYLLPNITIRFINTANEFDVVTSCPLGSNLLAVADAAGVRLPRACRTGLCGSCTTEVKDPNAAVTKSSPRPGFATVRACSVKCFIPEGETEMIIDVERTTQGQRKSTVSGEVYADPMARFSGDWEKDFRPRWELESQVDAGLQYTTPDRTLKKPKNCLVCGGSGQVQCYHCEGTGINVMTYGGTCQCQLCLSKLTVKCAECRGSGIIKPKKGSR